MNIIQFMQGLAPWKKDIGKGAQSIAASKRDEEKKKEKTASIKGKPT